MFHDSVYDYSFEFKDGSAIVEEVKEAGSWTDGEWQVIDHSEVSGNEPVEQNDVVEEEEDENDFNCDGPPLMGRRDTFVGTPLYVSPEMLHETKSLPASDLWALGCIIYRMHTGNVPFEARSETGTFDKILNRDLVFAPEANLSDSTKDVIDKLLQVNPRRRLGAGRPGSANDLRALYQHPYFEGINFEELASQPSPLGDLPDSIVEDSQFEQRRSASII